MINPTPALSPAAAMNSMAVPSCMTSAVTSGKEKVAPNTASKSPRTCATPSTAVLLSDRAHEQTFDCFDVSAVGQEHNHVIICLHDGVVMSHDDFISAYDGADRCAIRKFDLLDPTADHAR